MQNSKRSPLELFNIINVKEKNNRQSFVHLSIKFNFIRINLLSFHSGGHWWSIRRGRDS